MSVEKPAIRYPNFQVYYFIKILRIITPIRPIMPIDVSMTTPRFKSIFNTQVKVFLEKPEATIIYMTKHQTARSDGQYH